MKSLWLVLVLLLKGPLDAQVGPFDPGAWPPTVDPSATVHFTVVGDALPAPPGAVSWKPTLQILNGGDQTTSPVSVVGYDGLKATSRYLNTADPNGGYTEWADEPTIDILVQVYGDSAVLTQDGRSRLFNFLLGTLPTQNLHSPLGGEIPVEGKNFRWNWVLFRVTNYVRADGGRFCGSLAPDAIHAENGGVNGGTIRIEGVPELVIRAIAFGRN